MQLAQIDYYDNNYRDYNDTRVVQENTKRLIPALIRHRILLITIENNNHINPNNLCIECIFLKEGGEIHENQYL